MQLNLTLENAAKITGGTIVNGDPKTPFNSFIADSRTLESGGIFWALKGENFDGASFIPQAVEKGASVIVAQRGRAAGVSLGATALLEVENPLAALQSLAAYHRKRMFLKVAAVTGSNGKSTVKQMLLAICNTAGPTRANKGNLNNQFGVPFSLLEIEPSDKYGVFELGASRKGDIAEIAGPAAPDAAVITNIGPAHLEFFGDLKTVYDTKTEITGALNTGGTLVYNSDDVMLKNLKTEYKGKAVSFGFRAGADILIKKKKNFEFEYKGETFSFNLFFERHNKLNAAAAAGGAIALGLYKDNIERGLAAYEPMPMRMQYETRGNVTYILDCYNANPASMKNAVSILSKEKKKPRVAVLGDMKALGKASAKYHAELAEYLIKKKIDYIFISGPEMAAAAEVFRLHAPDINVKYSLECRDWVKDLKKLLSAGGTCLIKASRTMSYENIFKELA